MISPAFSFYAKDWLAATLSWSLEARGAYITLLAYQWDAGFVPAGHDQLARLLGVSEAKARKLWTIISAKFVHGSDGVLRNHRLEMERLKQQQYRGEQAAAGKRGAAARWARHGAPDGDPMPDPMATPSKNTWRNDGSSSSSSGISEDGNSPPVAPHGGRARKRRRHVREIPAADPVAVQQTIDTRARRAEMAAQGLTDAAIEAVLDAEYDARRRA